MSVLAQWGRLPQTENQEPKPSKVDDLLAFNTTLWETNKKQSLVLYGKSKEIQKEKNKVRYWCNRVNAMQTRSEQDKKQSERLMDMHIATRAIADSVNKTRMDIGDGEVILSRYEFDSLLAFLGVTK